MKRIIAFLAVMAALTGARAAAPDVGRVIADDPITLTLAGTRVVWCNATVADSDGFGNVSLVNATLFNPSITSPEGADNATSHYSANCTLSGGSGSTAKASCNWALQYYADADEWNCTMTASDGISTGTNATAGITVNALKAITVQPMLVFPLQSLGMITTDANEQALVVNNSGNTMINITLEGYAVTAGDGLSMNCTVGNITVSNLKYNATPAQNFSTGMTALTGSAATLQFNLERTLNGTASTKPAYWKLQMPTTGVGGNCTGKIVVTAV
ncbi:hypothetical protein HY642_00945 [Candidatus Woesearchaeota archaeon]|nr:hypothetical protein [Candidatus Woesearchaeota archaeon]